MANPAKVVDDFLSMFEEKPVGKIYIVIMKSSSEDDEVNDY